MEKTLHHNQKSLRQSSPDFLTLYQLFQLSGRFYQSSQTTSLPSKIGPSTQTLLNSYLTLSSFLSLVFILQTQPKQAPTPQAIRSSKDTWQSIWAFDETSTTFFSLSFGPQANI